MEYDNNHFIIASRAYSLQKGHRDTIAEVIGGHPPRVTSSRSLNRTNRNGELNTYARMQSKNTNGAQILHSQISPKQQMQYGIREEEQGRELTNDYKV
jgi:hypothetical protein